MGPRALAGRLDPSVLEMTDAEGMSLRAALAGFGGDPAALSGLARDPGAVLGYVELHIEQGPVLERAGVPLGVVTGICGIERNSLRFLGETGHAGTVPMAGRRDALVAAAGLVAAVPRLAEDFPGLRATVGTLRLSPDVVNAIPSQVDLVLEIRAENDADRVRFAALARAEAGRRAAAAGVSMTFETTYSQPAVACDPGLAGALERAAEACGHAAPRLPSGATHDASAMADLCPVAMLFLRCRGGVSHRPEEHATATDMGAAVEVLARMLAELAG
jgi:allantoate deiminase